MPKLTEAESLALNLVGTRVLDEAVSGGMGMLWRQEVEALNAAIGKLLQAAANSNELQALRAAVQEADQRMREVEAPADFDAYLGSAYGVGVLDCVKTLREYTNPHMEE